MDFPCKSCVYYDQQQKGTLAGLKDVWYGLCQARTVYQHAEGRTPPPGARTTDAPVGAPFVVRPGDVMTSCAQGIRR